MGASIAREASGGNRLEKNCFSIDFRQARPATAPKE
jgi:hypothetical protein